MFKQMRIKYSLLIFILSAVCFQTTSFATHIVGGDITYTCLGNDEYEITLTVRRDCENGATDAPFDDPAIVGIYDIFGSLQTSIGLLGRLELAFMGEDTITNSLVFDCGALGDPVCVHEAVYTGRVTLPYNKIGYCLAYQRCCRNLKLNNIENPLETGATYWTCITADALEACNSQPTFNNWPDVYLCVNENLVFDHSAVDPDGDQLVYRLCTPSQGATVDNPQPSPPPGPPYETVVWQDPYDLDDMMGGNPLSINPNTGEITARPNTIGSFLIGICVEEYRNGVLLSTVRRDFEYNVRACTDPIVIDFDVEDNDCDGDNIVSFTNNTTGADSYQWFFDYPNNTLTSTDENPTVTYPGQGKYTVRLEATRDADGCTTAAEQVVSNTNTPLEADFEAAFESCDNGNLIRLTDISVDPTGLSCAAEWNWTITSSNGTINENGQTVLIDVGNAQSIDVTLEVISSSNCISTVTKTIDVGSLFPSASFSTKLISCVLNGFLVEFTNTSTGLGNNVTTTWTIEDGINVNTLVGDPIQIQISGNDVTVTMDADSDNGCDASITRVVSPDEFVPAVNILNNLGGVDCPPAGSSTDITFSTGLSGGNMMANPVSYNWTIDGVNYTTETVTLPVMNGDLLNLQVDVTYDNGCTLSSNDQVFTASFVPDLDITEDVDCSVDGANMTLTNATGLAIQSQSWSVDGAVLSTDNSVTFPLNSNGSQVVYEVTFANGCSTSFSSNYDLDDYWFPPVVSYEVEPIDCEGDVGTFRFTNTSMIPACLEVESFVWMINGMTYTGEVVEVEIPLGVDINVSLTINFTNGESISTATDADNTNDVINTNDIVDPLDIMVENKLDVNCSDTLSLCVTNPNPNVDYEWSLDPDFNEIIGTGTNLNTLGGPNYNGVVYVRSTNNVGPCTYGDTVITIDSDAVDLTFDMPYVLCPGDTTAITVQNNNPSQTITYEWKEGGDNLISGGDTNMPVIGVPSDATEDFFMVLCTTNDLGCMSTDTIRFEIGTNGQLEPFTATVDSCGSLTVMFDEAPNMLNGNGEWDFGDGSATSNESAPTHTYDNPGNYTVTLTDLNPACPNDPVTVEIFVGDVDIFVEADTIRYGEDETPVVEAETNVNNGQVSWCDLMGNTIYEGNPLEGYDPPMDTMDVVVKVVDNFGCTDMDTITLIRDTDNSEECLESVGFDGPDMNIVCIGDTFQICVTMADDCDLADFTYMWEDNDCIIDGQDGPKITAVTDSDKTFNVLITSNTTGQDSIYSVDVTVSNPEVNITIDPDNIDPETGEPFLCLGQSVVLTAEGDPNCEYIWSTGDTGQSIEVSPEEDMTYTVTKIDASGCSSTSDPFTLPVMPPLCDESDVFIPNAFSPNGDNVNDVLFVRSKFIQEMELLIQDRWGEEVFESNDQSVGWDGTFKGKELAPDVYTYCLKVTCINDAEYIKVGNVSILK